MAIAVAGPILVAPFLDCLRLRSHPFSLPAGLGGTPVVNLVQGLLDRGHRVLVFTLDQSVTDEVILEGDQLKMCIGPFRKSGRARDFFATERNYLHRAIAREQPQVVHAHWTYEYALAALETGVPTLVTAHDAPLKILQLAPDLYRTVRTLMAWRVVRRALHMTAVSSHVATHLRRFFLYRGQMNVVPNAVPLAAFQLGDARSKRTAGANVTFASVLTGWSAVKNGKTALQAFAKVRKRLPDARLWMFGNGYGRSEAAQIWAARNGCADGVAFIGMLAHGQLITELARGVDILVHPAREEACPMAVAEAMALGIPVIGGKSSGGVPEVLEEGRVGMLANVASADDLAEAMHQLAAESDLRANLTQLARCSAQKRFTPSVVAARYEGLLSGLINSHGTRAAHP